MGHNLRDRLRRVEVRRAERVEADRPLVVEIIPTDPDVARLVAAWPTLPEHIKAAIRALVGTVTRGQP